MTPTGAVGGAASVSGPEAVLGAVRVGLTGGIGSGKSTVARALEVLGARVYYADVRARELMNSPDLAAEISSLLGSQAYREGVLDRKYVASRVFADASLLAALNAIVHPRVARDWKEFCERHAAEQGSPEHSERTTRRVGAAACRDGSQKDASLPTRSTAHVATTPVAPAPSHPERSPQGEVEGSRVRSETLRQAQGDSEKRDLLILESAILFESGFAALVDRVITVETPLEERVERVMARDGVTREAVEARMRAQMSDGERAEKADYIIRNGEHDEVLPCIMELYDEL